MRTLIYNGIVVNKEGYFQQDVLIENGKILKVEKDINENVEQKIDAKGNYIIPCLIDSHTHGVLGYDFNTCKASDINEIAKYYRQEGVSSFMASIVCEKHEKLMQILNMYETVNCKAFAGVHLEGPYLNINKKAVMKEACLRLPNLNEFKEYRSQSSKLLSMTIAPELASALSLIEYGNKHGVVMNIGHSEGDVEDVLKAQEMGAKGITHLYNAMSQHEHRSPGVVTGAILSNLYCELIADGFHVHKDVVNATYKMLEAKRIVLISDANPCKGLSDGEYEFSGKQIVIKNQEATVKETGRIAGSTLSMKKACQNMMKYCGVGIHECMIMASYNPACLYGLNKGNIKIGYDGDILVVNKDFEILHMCSEDKIWY